MADSKNMVIKIVSDAKDFVKGMEDALRQIQSASEKAQSFDKIAEDAANLKEQLSKVAENLTKVESAAEAGSTVTDAQISTLKNNVENLNKKFDSFRHTFKTLQETVNSLNTDRLNSQMEKLASNMKEVTSQYFLLRKESQGFLSNKTDLKDITNINQLKKAFNEAKFVFENFDEASKKTLKGDYTKNYQEAASALFKYAEALIQIDGIYAKGNNGDSYLSEDLLDSLPQISEKASKIISSQVSQIRNTIETMFSSIDVGSFFQEQITGTIEGGTKGFLVKGAIEIPVKLKENAKRDITSQVEEIIGNAQNQINENPIVFNFKPVEEKDNKLAQAINSYFDDISKRLQEQAQELNNTMGKILGETGIKETQQNFEGIATSITQLLANLKDFSKEITDVEKANGRFNSSFSSENLGLYVKNLEEISDSFKKLISAIDNISTKLNKNGLESQFEIIKNSFSNFDLDSLIEKKKEKKIKTAQDLGLSIEGIEEEKKDLELIKERKKQLRELFSLYSTYQARGGIRPITDLLFEESDEEKIKYLNNEYGKYVKSIKSTKKKTNKTDLGSDIFIPSGILETDKEQLNEILSLLKDINQVLQNIGKTGINTSNSLKPLVNAQKTDNTNANINSTSSKVQGTRTPKQKPIIPSKKEKENEQKEQSIQKEKSSQKEQTTQEITNTNQKVVESNKKLAESAEEAAQAIQQEKVTTKELTKEEKEKKINGLMYHLGNLNDSSKRFSHPFGDEIKSWFTGIKDSGRGWGDGTGLYATKDVNAFSQKSLSDKSLEKFYAIDTSDLNLYEAHAEETAKEFNDFIHHLEQFCISMGSNFEGFDDNLEGIDEESLFSTAQKLFPNFNNIFKDFNSFYDWVNQMITLVSKSGIKADGTINSKQMYNFKKEYGTDDIKTRFLKQLGYQGTDLSGTSFGGVQSGNVIFDTVEAERIIASGKQIDEVSQQAKKTIVGIKEEIKETSKAESELGKEVENVTNKIEVQGNEAKKVSTDTKNTEQSVPIATKKPVKPTIKPITTEQQISNEENNIQQQVKQTENNVENSEKNIINLVNNIKESLEGLRKDLKILAEMIVVIEGATEQKDYVGQIETIKNGIITLNVLILELSRNIKSIDLSKIDFGKINKLEFSSDPFDNIVNSLKEIIDLIERITGVTSKSNLKSQFDYIQTLYNSMVNDNGKFVARGNKSKLQLMYSLYDEYKKGGGQMSLHRLTDTKSNQEKLYRQYGYYQSRTKDKNITDNSNEGIKNYEQLKSENEALKESVKVLTEVINNKQKLSEANKSVTESTKSSAKEIENENQKIKESNNQTEKAKNKTKKSKNKEEQYSPNFTMVGEPYGEEIVNKNLQKNTSMVPTNGFTMVGDGYVEDVEHTQVRVQEAVKETTKQIEQQKTELETAPNIEVFEGEVIGAEKELAKIYQQELDEFKKGFKSYEEAYRSMEERFAEWYETQGYNHTKSIFNVTPDFQLKSATITRENPEDKNIITDSFKRITNKKTGESKIIQTNIQLIDNEQKRVSSFTKELERNQREREKLGQWIASFNNKTSNNFLQTNQMLELNQFANDASLINEKSLQRAETLKTELETVYNDVVNNARRGSSSLSPIPNMMFGEESTLTKLEKAQSIYDKMAITWNKEDDSKRLKNTEKELQLLTDAYKKLEEAVKQYDTIDENGNRLGNVVEVSNAYGNFNEQLNKVTQQLNRIKNINTEINGNKINNLINWFKDIPNPNEIEAQNLGKIDKYTEVYNQFVDFQNRLQSLTTNLSKGDEDYNNKKQQIHEITLELDRMKKILSSDDMNLSNQTGAVIKQNLPEVNDVKELDNVVDEYIKDLGVVQKSFDVGLKADKEGNEFAKFTREVKDSKGAVTEFEFTYNKAMGTIAVATKKIQQPESILKTLTDELTTKWRGLFTTLGSFVGFYRLWGYFKQGISTVREFDAALTEMQKVSDETIFTLQNYQKTTFDTADTIGTTALQIQNSTADFMRLGESLKEASESAKVANVLMNVSEFQSIDEATKSLIAMGAAYDNLSKMDIIDKLNEVGNNYAISTSEAATALQSSASALKTAKNDMDEALALITAGNAVVQDANKVGTGMRTIALRLTGTKSAKEELEELGEETDSMLATQSKLRDTIKEATAVASNEFKGFDILDDNGNYKSTYEIMLGIAEIYNEILETDKQLGRNNANLLLESVAGKVRANIAASIFQNPELLKEAYKSSQEAENSAMEENEKYMDSINGHIAQLQNAYQQLWANSMNRDTINYFVDLGKSILNVVDNVGLLGTAFIAITGIKSIVGYQNKKGFAYEIIKGCKAAIEYLAKSEGAMGSLASSAISAGQAIGGTFSAAIPIIGGIGTAIALAAIGFNAFIQHQKQAQKELVDSAKTTGNEWKEQKQSLEEYASQYEDLKTKLDSENLSEQETIKTKQQIYDIQKQITEQYGRNVGNIDLINGKLQEQLNIINSISQAEANRIWQSQDYQKGFEIAKEAMTSEKEYGATSYGYNLTTPENAAFSRIVQKYTQERIKVNPDGSTEKYRATIGNPEEAEKRILKQIEEIEKLQTEYPNNEKLQKITETYLDKLTAARDEIVEINNNNRQVWLDGLAVLMAKEGKSDVFDNYQSSIANLESAYDSGNDKNIKEARKSFEEASKAKDEFLKIDNNNQFIALFDNVNTSLVDTKNKVYDAIESFKVAKEINDEINQYNESVKQGKNLDEATKVRIRDLRDITKANGKYTKENKKLAKALKEVISLDMDRIDAEMVFDENSNSSEIFSNALHNLMDAMGWTIDDASLLVDTLVDAGFIQGNVTDATNTAVDSYSSFSQTIASAIENVSKLNTVLSESVSGSNILTQNLDAFKEMFGDDYVYALERTANGYHINIEKLQTLTDKQNALINTDFQKTLDAQYDALKRCNDEIIKANNEQKDTSGLLAQRQGILQRIQDTKDLMMTYEASTSAFQKWVNAQSNGNEYDMYDKIATGYNTVKDLIDRGWSGDDTVRSYLDLIYGSSFDAFTASGEECAEMFDNLDKKIEGTSFSITDFFQMDESGKLTSNGIFNFFDAVEEKQKELNKNWLKFDENGNIESYNFGFGRDREVSEALGLDVELIQSILRAAVAAGFEVNLDQPMWAMDELEKKAIKAQEELGGFNDINFDELYNNLDNEDAYKTISNHIDSIYDFIQEIENSNLSPKLKTQQIKQAQDMLSYLVTLEREAADRGEIDLKATVVGSATDKISQLIDETKTLPDVLKEYNWDEITDKNGLQQARDFIAAEIEGGKIDTTSAESFLNILDQALYELGLIDNYEANPTFQGNTVGAYNEVAQAKIDLQEYLNTVREIEKENPEFKINYSEDPELQRILSIIYGEGATPDIQTALKINPDSSAELIYEILESGERDVDVILQGDTTQLKEDIKDASKSSSVSIEENKSVTSTETKISKEENYSTSIMDINDDAFNQKLALDKEQANAFADINITPNIDANIEPAQEKLAQLNQEGQEYENSNPESELKAKDDASPIVQVASTAVKGFGELVSTAHLYLGGDALDDINSFSTKWNSLQSKTITLSTIEKTIAGANGTAHAYGTVFSKGTAYAGGKWGLSQDQTALAGELGTEIVVRDGNWFTVGNDGAEFVNLQKGDIVFNHKQSEELLENGYVTSNKGRGHLVGFANGTAYSSGSIKGATKAKVKTTSVSSKSNSKSSGGSNSSGRSGGNGGNGGNSSSSEQAKETKNTLDEVEILISRIERQISNLDKTIGNTYLTWSTRNKGITKQLGLVSQEIKDQNKAAATYMKKANSLGLSESWKKKIQSGKFKIEDVVEKAKESGDTSDSLWDKITKYKDYYEKALAAKDAVIDLREKEGELYKQRFDNEQTYYEELLDALQFTIDRMGTYNDQLEESGKLSAKNYIVAQLTTEQSKISKLNQEYKALIKKRDDAVKSGKIKKGSEAWYEMQEAIRGVSEAIQEANTNIISYYNALNDVDWTRWEKVHDAIGGVTNELEFLYDLLNEDDMFDEQGTITNQGITAFGILAQEYDTYFREVQKYQEEIDRTQKQLADDPYNQTLVDKLKDLKEAQQDAASNAKKMKDSMVDVTEKGIKKQIDYVKQLIDDYEELLDTQKDQIDYAKKVADQQKEINQLEKQYRAIQNDTSEEGATKRQRLREQINEKRESLQETQEDRRISETKDMLSDFEESFEDFLNNKLKDVEGIVKQVISTTNDNGNIIKNTITDTATKYGYTISDTLNNTLNNLSNNLVSYFSAAFDNNKVNAIINGVNTIVDYYDKAQSESEKSAMTTRINESGSKIQNYADKDNKIQTGIFNSDGTQKKITTGWSTTGGKTYRFENGQMLKSQWTTVDGKKYYLNSSGARVTGWQTIGGKKYYFDENGVQYNNSKGTFHAINGSKYYFNAGGVLNTKDGLIQSGSHTYYIKGGKSQTGWQTIGGYQYYFDKNGFMFTGTHKINGKQYIFDKKGRLIGGSGTKVVGTTSKNSTKLSSHASGSASIKKTGLAWTNENGKDEAIIRKSDGAILTPLNRGDSVIPNSAMKNMYKALTDPEKYLKQYTSPDIRIVQPNGSNNNSSPATVNMQFIANGVQDANKFVNDLMNNKKLEKWVQEVTLGQANGNSSYKKYSYVLR